MRTSGISLVAEWTVEERMADENGNTLIIPLQEAKTAFEDNSALIVLPWTELTLGLCLLFNIFTPGASVLAAGWMTLFISIIAFNLLRGFDVGCGCFSTSATETMNILTWLRDISIPALSGGLVWLAHRRFNQRTPTIR